MYFIYVILVPKYTIKLLMYNKRNRKLYILKIFQSGLAYFLNFKAFISHVY